MSGSCAVYGCSNSRKNSEGLRFFKFPNDNSTRQEWLEFCQRSDPVNLKYAQICSVHFLDTDFEDAVKAQILNRRPTCLKKTSVPSLKYNKEKQTYEEDKGSKVKYKNSKKLKRLQKKKAKDKSCSNKNKTTKPTNNTTTILIAQPLAAIGTVLHTGNINQLSNDQINLMSEHESSSLVKREGHFENQSVVEPEVILSLDHSPNKQSDLDTSTQNTDPSLITESMEPDNIGSNTTSAPPATSSIPLVTTQPIKPVTSIIYQPQFVPALESPYMQIIDSLQKQLHEKDTKLKMLHEQRNKMKVEAVNECKNKLKLVFSETQVNFLLGDKIFPHWSDDDMISGLIIYRVSSKCYKYLRNVKNYPLPAISTLNRWVKNNPEKLLMLENEDDKFSDSSSDSGEHDSS